MSQRQVEQKLVAPGDIWSFLEPRERTRHRAEGRVEGEQGIMRTGEHAFVDHQPVGPLIVEGAEQAGKVGVVAVVDLTDGLRKVSEPV